MRSYRLDLGLTIAVFVLLFASFEITVSAAGQEPFMAFSKEDAIHYLGFGAILTACWAIFDVVIVIGVACKRLSPWWLLGMLLSFAGIFGLGIATDAWMSDMEFHAFNVKHDRETSTAR